MRKKILFSIFIFLFSFLMLCEAGQLNAQEVTGTGCTGEGCTLPNPLNPGGKPEDNPSPQQLIGKVIIAALGIVGSIALLMFIYGGFVWMTAAGNQEMVTRGRNILMWAAIGLVIIFSSYALVKFVFQGVGA